MIAAKLRAQHKLLAQAMAARPDQRKPLTDGQQTVANCLARLDAAADQVAQSLALDSLRGLEGAAAAAYFQALTAIFAPALNFTGRNRRPPCDPVNACLSLAYTLAHFEAVLACQSAGLDPLLGFYHEPAHGRDTLAADLIEPLRPRIDGWVWEMFREARLSADHFSEDKGACLLGKNGRKIFYSHWENFAKPIRRWLRQQCHGLVRQLAETAATDHDENHKEAEYEAL